MNEIVARLRKEAQWLRGEDHAIPKDVKLTVESAAEEIERLQIKSEQMFTALYRISHAPRGKVYCADGHEEAVLIARAALGEDKK